MTFASTLAKRRKELGLTQGQLAGALDVDKQSISNWETGRSTPWPKDQVKILTTLLEWNGAEPARKPRRPRVIDKLTWED